MTLVLSTPANPGTAAWTDASTLPGTRLPLNIVPLIGVGYLIPDGDDAVYLFETTTVDSVTLPPVANNVGRTLIVTCSGSNFINFNTSGSDGIAPYFNPVLIDPTASPRCVTFVAIEAASSLYGVDCWLITSQF